MSEFKLERQMRDALIRPSLSELGPGPNVIRSYLSKFPPRIPPIFIRIVKYLTWCSIEQLFLEHNVNKLDQFFNMVFYIKSFLEHRLKILDQFSKSIDKPQKAVILVLSKLRE
jgi:hypothetical protein